jgi:hypothetical protein
MISEAEIMLGTIKRRVSEDADRVLWAHQKKASEVLVYVRFVERQVQRDDKRDDASDSSVEVRQVRWQKAPVVVPLLSRFRAIFN